MGNKQSKQSAVRYRPLQRNEIRLLRLRMAKDVVLMEMSTHPINACPDYIAVSYTWGQDKEAYPINVNGYPALVRANLFTFLKHARGEFDTAERNPYKVGLKNGADVRSAPGTDILGHFWVDAICINQEDNVERTVQMAIAGDVYRRACKTVIWLGPPSDGSDQAMDLMDKFHKMHDSGRPMQEGMQLLQNNEEALQAIVALFNRPYWQRVRIIEEATCQGKYPNAVWCGNKRIDWAALVLTNNVMARLGLSPKLTYNFNSRAVLNLSNIKMARYPKTPAPPLRLIKLLQYLRRYNATDPRDKLYSVMRLALDGQDPGLRSRIEVPVTGVYQHFVKNVILMHNNLDILGFCFWHKQLDQFDLPSWVPDWHSYFPRPLPKQRWTEHGGFTNIYNAARGTAANARFVEPSSLIVEGIVFDEVVDVSCPRGTLEPGKFDLLDDLGTAIDWVCFVMQSFPNGSYISGGTPADALRRVVCADAEHWEEERAVRGAHAEWQVELMYEGMNGATLPWSDGDLFNSGKNGSMIHEMTHHRRLLKTSKGYLGLASMETQVGDKVCVLHGSSVPMILRPNGSKWSLVGEGYVHGIMDAEAFNQIDSLVRELEITTKAPSKTQHTAERYQFIDSIGPSSTRSQAIPDAPVVQRQLALRPSGVAESKQMERFPYGRLADPSSHTRLLKVLAHTPEEDTKFICSIQHYDLYSNTLEYVAMSYTWWAPFSGLDGYDKDNMVNIHVQDANGKSGAIPISRNLYEGLQVWIEKPEWRDHFVWIDQVCINQIDLSEQTEQVKIMDKIYSKNTATFAWLGKENKPGETSESEGLFEMHRILYRKGTEYEQRYKQPILPSDILSANGLVTIKRLGLVIPGALVHQFYQFLRRCQYFSRIWIVQEQAIAKTSTLFFDKRSLPRAEVVWLVQFWQNNHMHVEAYNVPGEAGKGGKTTDVAEKIVIFGEITRMHQNGGIDDSLASPTIRFITRLKDSPDRRKLCWGYLQHLITKTSFCDAGKPHDRIYGLLGLVSPLLLQDGRPFIEVDYNMKSADLFRRVTEDLITETDSLSALALVPDMKQRKETALESWVPEFSAYTTGLAPSLILHVLTYGKNVFLAGLDNDAAGLTPARFEGSKPRKLIINAIRVDKILNCSVESPFLALHSQENRVENAQEDWIWLIEACCDPKLAPRYRNGQLVAQAAAELCTFLTPKFREPKQLLERFHALLVINGYTLPNVDRYLNSNFSGRYLRALQRACYIPNFPTHAEIQKLSAFMKQCRSFATKEEVTAHTNHIISTDLLQLYHLHINFQGRCHNTANMRKLMRSENGYLGRVPASVNKGDEIWVAYGAWVPYILRPTKIPGEYVFLGEAYVHGIMCGEVVKERRATMGTAGCYQRIALV